MKVLARISFVTAVIVMSVAVSAKAQTTIAQWTFEHFTTNNVNTSGPLSPENGTETGTALGTASHASGAVVYSEPAGDLDPNVTPPASGSSIRSWSAQQWAVGDFWQFEVNTSGYTGVNVAWDQAGSGTGPGHFSLMYSNSATAGAFVSLLGPYTVPLSTWNTALSAPLQTNVNAGVVDNTGDVIFRLVDQDTVSVNGGTVATGGTDRVDNFTVTAIPEPSTILMVVAGLAGMIMIRRRS